MNRDHVLEIIKKLNPETALFVIVSKMENSTNANTIKNWLIKNLIKIKAFTAVSTNQSNTKILELNLIMFQ